MKPPRFALNVSLLCGVTNKTLPIAHFCRTARREWQLWNRVNWNSNREINNIHCLEKVPDFLCNQLITDHDHSVEELWQINRCGVLCSRQSSSTCSHLTTSRCWIPEIARKKVKTLSLSFLALSSRTQHHYCVPYWSNHPRL
jgi:hypothetical protein